VHAFGNSENPGLGVWMAQHFFVTNAMRTYAKFKLQKWSGNLTRRRLAPEPASGWLFSPNPFEATDYGPLGSAQGAARSLEHMQALADLLKRSGIPLTIVVYPWPVQLALPDRDNRQVSLWRNFRATNCKHSSTHIPHSWPKHAPTRTGTSASSSRATPTSRPKARVSCSRCSSRICCRRAERNGKMSA
jgi:hypothetical protein